MHPLSKLSKRTIREVPFLLKPFFWCVMALVGLQMYLQNVIHKSLIRIEYVGKENIETIPNQIFSVWHENVALFFLTHRQFRKPNCWITFPLWYFAGVHVLQKMIGVKELAVGTSGIAGQKALRKVIHRLQEGWSTFITPDGPHGPLKKAKHGVLQMSLQSKTPIIPIGFYVEREWRSNSWDRKRYPSFGVTLIVQYGKPVTVTKENYDEARQLISEGMNDLTQLIVGSSVPPNL